MVKRRGTIALLLVSLLFLAGCSVLAESFIPDPGSPGKSSFKPFSSPSGSYGQFYLGLVRVPKGVEGGNGCYDDKGTFVVLINNNAAEDPTYARLIEFLEQDTTDDFPYQLQFNPNAVFFSKPENLVNLSRIRNIIDGSEIPSPPLICADFAERLHNNAEMAGIRCGYVTIDFEGRAIGHALAVFNTTDKGMIYVDDTGVEKHVTGLEMSGENTSVTRSNDKAAYISTGQAYGLITLENAAAFGFDYAGYENWLASHKQLESLEAVYKDLEGKITPLKIQIDAMQIQYNDLKQQYDQLTGGRVTLPPNIYSQAVPIMNQMKTVNEQRNRLIDSMNSFINQLNEVVKQHNEIVIKMGPTWESLGTISNFFVTWDGEWRN